MRRSEQAEQPRRRKPLVALAEDSRGAILPVRAHAAARRQGVLGAREGMLRVAVTAAPEKGKANQAIIELLSQTLGVPKSAIKLVSGESVPRKRFLIVGRKVCELSPIVERLAADQL
jgi:uncharacterized protein (TIGR00251 family)